MTGHQTHAKLTVIGKNLPSKCILIARGQSPIDHRKGNCRPNHF
jgi:hypothetical protein